MSRRYDAIEIPYTQDFGRPGRLVIPLTIDEQEDPRLRAVIDWYREIQQARAAAMRGDGDVFGLG